MNVEHCNVGPLLLIVGHSGNSLGLVVEVCIRITVKVEEQNEGSSIGIGNGAVLFEVAVCLAGFEGSGRETAAVKSACFSVFVCLGGILTVVELPGEGLDGDVVLVPVGVVSGEYDGAVSAVWLVTV